MRGMSNPFKPEVEWRGVESITPYVKNTKKHPTEQIDKIAGSIAEFGWDQPIVIDGDGVIIKGHGRREAALRLGLEIVPVVVRTDLTVAQVKAARIADNRVAESEWDREMLGLELADLKLADFDLTLTGFTPLELDVLTSKQSDGDPWDGPDSGGEGSAGAGAGGQLGRILLVYEQSEYETVFTLAEQAMDDLGVNDMSVLFRRLLEERVNAGACG